VSELHKENTDHESRLAFVAVPRTKGSQIGVCHETEKVAEFSNIQSAIAIPVGDLELRFDETQQLVLADGAIINASADLSRRFDH
jgi:hypothetical protein